MVISFFDMVVLAVKAFLILFLAMYVALYLQQVLFLEYRTRKQDKRIKITLLIINVLFGIALATTVGFALVKIEMPIIYIYSISMMVIYVYSAFVGRKRAKWLAFFEWIPVLGFIDGLLAAVDAVEKMLGGNIVIDIILLICIIVLGIVLAKMKPEFVRALKKDIEVRCLTVGEEVLIWAAGLWLIITNEVFDAVIKETATGFAYYYIAILNFILVIILIIFVLTSNYRDYYAKKSMQLKEMLVDTMENLEKQNKATLMALTRAIEAKDRYTKGHSARVAKYSKMLAARMEKSTEEQEEIYNVALLHDVGKIRVPEEVINKAGKLTDEEFDYIKLHPVAGSNILKDIRGNSQLSIGAKFHHERYDGKGYPNGISGKNIPEIARIIAVADSYDAMASNRSYRKALPQEVVRGEIEKGMGTQFDPEIAKVMLEIIDEDKDYNLREKDTLEKNILVVDDTIMNIMLAEHILKKEAMYSILKAESGKEALERLSENDIDLVLLDIEMPGMDGFETLDKIREVSNVPVIFMTADKELTTIERANEMGVEDYITKPFSQPGLLESVYGALYHIDMD